MTLYQFFFRFRFCIFFKNSRVMFRWKKNIKQEQHSNFWSDWTWTYCEVAYITFCMKNRGVSTIHFCFQPVMVVNLCQNTRLHFWDYDQQLHTGYCAMYRYCCWKMFIMGQKFEEVSNTKRSWACQSAYYSHVKTSKTVLASPMPKPLRNSVNVSGMVSKFGISDTGNVWPIKLPFQWKDPLSAFGPPFSVAG